MDVGGPQVEADVSQAGGRHVDVAVHECRCHERAVEFNEVGVGKLGSGHVVAAEPGDDVTAHGHGRGVGVRGAVDAPAEQHCRHGRNVACGRLGDRERR